MTTLYVLRGARNRYGDIDDGGTELPLKGCLVAPSYSVENQAGFADTTVSGFVVYVKTPKEIDVKPQDRIRYGSMVCQVTGEVMEWDSGFSGARRGYQFTMTRYRGG